MNFVEALKIKRPIRRIGKASHVGSDGLGWVDPDYLLTTFNSGFLTKEDILAEDWEVRSETIELSKEQFFESVVDVAKRKAIADWTVEYYPSTFDKYILECVVPIWELMKSKGKL